MTAVVPLEPGDIPAMRDLLIAGLLVRHARDLGAREVVLETTSTWHSAIAFYSKHGFCKTHELGGDCYFLLPLSQP